MSGPVTNFNFDPQGNIVTGGGGVPASTQFDSDGYPIPTGSQATVMTGYDPTLPPPQPATDNPYNPVSQKDAYTIWARHNDRLAANQQSKTVWQQQHASQRQVAPSAPAAPQPAFQSSGVDLTKKGVGENYADSILQQYQASGIPQVGNNGQAVFNQFQQSQPQNMDPYYDNAQRLSDRSIDASMAARGSYGSSNAMGQLANADTNLRAQQARDEAQYGLSRYGMASSLAGQADQQGNVANGIQYQWTNGLNNIATGDQQLGQDRNQQLWNNNLNLATIQSGIVGRAGSGAIEDTGAATNASINANLGQSTDRLSGVTQQTNTDAAQTSNTLNSAGTAMKNIYTSGQF